MNIISIIRMMNIIKRMNSIEKGYIYLMKNKAGHNIVVAYTV